MKRLIITAVILVLSGCAGVKKLEPPVNYNKPENLSLCQKGWSMSEENLQWTAIGMYEECIKTGNLRPNNLSRTYRNIGIAYRRNKQPDMAIKYFEESLSRNPSDPWADYINIGNSWDDLKNFERAMKTYDHVIKNYPSNSDVYYNKGISLENQDKWKEASVEFDKAYELGLRSRALLERIQVHKIRREKGME